MQFQDLNLKIKLLLLINFILPFTLSSTCDSINSQLQFNSCPGGFRCVNCKATLITENWAITSASCVDWYQQGMSLDDSRLTDVFDQKYLLSRTAQTPIMIHPDFKNGLKNDIALIKLPVTNLPKACLSETCQTATPENEQIFTNFYDCNRDAFYGVLDGTSICTNLDSVSSTIGYNNIFPGTPVFDSEGFLRGIFGWASETQFSRGQNFISLTRVSSFMEWVVREIQGQGDFIENSDVWLNGTHGKCIEGSGPTNSGFDMMASGSAQSDKGDMEETITEKTGYISTPHYGKADYPNNYKHTWRFRNTDFISEASCVFYNGKPFATIDFHFSEQMVLEGTKYKVCYDKLVFNYRLDNEAKEEKTIEFCGDHESFDLNIPSTDLNITFTSDYSMAKKGFYAKFQVIYNNECLGTQDAGGYDYETKESSPGGARAMVGFNDYGENPNEIPKLISIDARHDPGTSENSDNRATEQPNESDMKTFYWIIGGAIFVIVATAAIVILLNVQTQLKKVTIITTGQDGAGDAGPNVDSEKGFNSVKAATSVEGFTREDVEMITEHAQVLSAINNKSMSSIRSSPNKNQSNTSYQITTQYHAPKADKFKRLSRKNAIQDIHDHEAKIESQESFKSPLVRKQAIQEILPSKNNRNLVRKFANHDIHGRDEFDDYQNRREEFARRDFEERNVDRQISREHLGYDMFLTRHKDSKILTPRHSSPTVNHSSVSIPQQLLRQKVEKKKKGNANYPNPSTSTQSLKKFEQIEEIEEYVVKLKPSQARMSIHSLHSESLPNYPKYPSHNTDHVETRTLPRIPSFSEENPAIYPRRVEEKISVNSRHFPKSSKNFTNRNDPFVVRPSDAKTSVSIADLSKSTLDDSMENNNNSYNSHNYNSSYENDKNNNNNNKSSPKPVKVSSLYSRKSMSSLQEENRSNNQEVQVQQAQNKMDQENKDNSVDQIIDSL